MTLYVDKTRLPWVYNQWNSHLLESDMSTGHCPVSSSICSSYCSLMLINNLINNTLQDQNMLLIDIICWYLTFMHNMFK